MPISARLIVNPAALKLKRDVVQPLLDALAAAGGARPDGTARLPPARRRGPGFDAALAALIAFEAAQDPGVDATVARIVATCARAATRRCSSTRRSSTACSATRRGRARDHRRRDAARAFDALPAEQRAALETAAARIRAYHERQKIGVWSYREADGSELGQQVTPLDRVGVYVPGGKAAYPSSVLMNVIPGARRRRARDRHGRADARAASAIRWCSPPRTSPACRARSRSAARRRSRRSPTARRRSRRSTRSAARATPTSPRRSGASSARSASTWLPAPPRSWSSPTRRANPDWVAMDLFSQAEHDELAQAILRHAGSRRCSRRSRRARSGRSPTCRGARSSPRRSRTAAR